MLASWILDSLIYHSIQYVILLLVNGLSFISNKEYVYRSYRTISKYFDYSFRKSISVKVNGGAKFIHNLHLTNYWATVIILPQSSLVTRSRYHHIDRSLPIILHQCLNNLLQLLAHDVCIHLVAAQYVWTYSSSIPSIQHIIASWILDSLIHPKHTMCDRFAC